MRWISFHVFVYPTRLKLMLLPARLMQKIGLYQLLRKIGVFKLLPAQFRKMEQMLPPHGPVWAKVLPAKISATRAGDASKPKITVAFFPGCIGSVMFEKVNRQAVELLAACGADVIVPPAIGCCGAIHHHGGEHAPAEHFARQNIDACFPPDGSAPTYIVTTIAGCGAMLKDYDVLLRDDPQYAERAKVFASKVRDISQAVLFELGLPPIKEPINETITFHDARHLAHAQRQYASEAAKIAGTNPRLENHPTARKRNLLRRRGHVYNLEHPDMATQLAQRKLGNIATTGANICVTGNVLRAYADRIRSRFARGQKLIVCHPVELLHRAVFSD